MGTPLRAVTLTPRQRPAPTSRPAQPVYGFLKTPWLPEASPADGLLLSAVRTPPTTIGEPRLLHS